MKKMLLTLILTMLAFYAHCEGQLTLSFSKNSSGELILTVTGHTTPVVITIDEVKVTLYPEENKVNLSAMGIKELLEVSDITLHKIYNKTYRLLGIIQNTEITKQFVNDITKKIIFHQPLNL